MALMRWIMESMQAIYINYDIGADHQPGDCVKHY